MNPPNRPPFLRIERLEARHEQTRQATDEATCRTWRLYMAGSAVNFEAGRTQIHQVLATRADGGTSGMPLRPTFE